MLETEDFTSPFRDFACNHCGWCCQRTPCALGVLQGAPLRGPCPFLAMDEKEKSSCLLLTREQNPHKQLAVSQLMLAGQGCTHRFGPHPLSLLKELLQRGLKVNSPEWDYAKKQTVVEMERFAQESSDPASIHKAMEDFLSFCNSKERGE